MRSLEIRSLRQLRAGHEALLARLQAALRPRGPEGDDLAALRGLADDIAAFVDAAVQAGAFIGTEFVDDRTAAQVIVDYWAAKLAHASGRPGLRELAAFDPATNDDLPESACPYPGAAAVAAGRALPGRDDEVRAVVAGVERWPLVVVTGPLGCGKSSLMDAGVAPALRRQCRADGGPRWQVPPAMPASAADVEAWVAMAAPDPPWVLILDPGDVLFADPGGEPGRHQGAAARAALSQAVDRLLASGAGHRVVLVLGEEHMARLGELAPMSRWLEPRGPQEPGAPKSVVGVAALAPAALRDALLAPAESVGLQVHPELVEAVVAHVAGHRSALVLLQFAAREIWKARKGHMVGREATAEIVRGIEMRRLQWLAEQQGAAATREHERAERERAIAQAQRRLARRERWGLVFQGLVLAALAVAWWLEYREHRRLDAEVDRVQVQTERQAVEAEGARRELARKSAEVEALRAALARRGSMDADVASPAPVTTLRQEGSQRAPPPGGPAARATAAASIAGSAAAAATTTAVAVGPAPAPPLPLPVAPDAPRPSDGPIRPGAATGAVPAEASGVPAPTAPSVPAEPAEPLSDRQAEARASRLVYWLDTGHLPRRFEDVRREYPLSWAWAKARWKELQLRTPLSLAVLFDTAVAHGPLQAAIYRAGVSKAGNSLESERAFVVSYLDRRQAHPDRALMADLYPKLEAGRLQHLRERVRSGDWDLEADPSARP